MGKGESGEVRGGGGEGDRKEEIAYLHLHTAENDCNIYLLQKQKQRNNPTKHKQINKQK